MKVYSFGREDAPVVMLLPGTCCHWKGNFGHVIPLLAIDYHVLCVSYDGFDETEQTEFPTMTEEVAKIEDYIREHCGGHISAAYGCSLGGSFVGLLAARRNIRMDHGILGSSDLDQASKFTAKLQTELLLPMLALPFFVPVVTPAALGTAKLLAGRPFAELLPMLKLLLAFDMIFVVACTLAFPFTLED